MLQRHTASPNPGTPGTVPGEDSAVTTLGILRRTGAAVLAGATLLGVATTGTAQAAGDASAPATTSVSAAYASAVSTPRVDSYYPAHGNGVVDALHYDLDLTWQRGTRSLTGTEQLVLRAARDADAIPLDLADALAVTAATVDGEAVTATQDDDHVTLPVPVTSDSVHTVTLTYAGVPRPVRAPGTRSDSATVGFTSRSDGRAFTMQEPYGAFTWYAVNDQPADKALYDFTLHVAAPFVGIANGELAGRRTAGGVTTTHWHLATPAAAYLTTVAFGKYKRTSLGKVDGTPVSYWTPTSRPKLATRLRFMAADLRWLEKRLGRYPFDSLSLVVVPSDSAMETQTMITEGSTSYALEEENVVHEMSHQWYGDQVTPNDWRDVWMNEGMAMYVEYLWMDHRDGLRPGTWVSYETRRQDNRLRREYGPPGAYDAGDFASSNVYLPPARMWWRLSRELGARTFARLLRRWPASHAHSSQSREVLEDWWSARSGRDLHPFFQRWLLAAKDPS